MNKRALTIALFFKLGALAACSGSGAPSSSSSADSGIDLSSTVDGEGGAADAGTTDPKALTDGGYAIADAGVVRADRFVMKVESVTYGACAGFGQAYLPEVVMGPPQGGGADHGSLDVLSLGTAGQIVLSFGDNAIEDGPGADFIVFENPFIVGSSTNVYAEPGEVSVSEDGVTWSTYPCTASFMTPPYGACAGWHPVYSAPNNGISPFDVTNAGGDAFDLADVGLKEARFVRIVDKAGEACDQDAGITTNGFDLDAIAIVHAKIP